MSGSFRRNVTPLAPPQRTSRALSGAGPEVRSQDDSRQWLYGLTLNALLGTAAPACDNQRLGGNPMRHILSAPVLAAVVIAAQADPVTPPAHRENNLRAIGGGLYLERDADLSADQNGNVMLMVLSHQGISAGGHYTVDLAKLANRRFGGDLAYDGGTLGVLRMQSITLDCAHRTYEVFDTSKALPEPIWRAAFTLPALAPLFRYVCAHQVQK